MNTGEDLLALNLAWVGWEMARWQDVVDWSISAAGAVTLLALNIIRLRRALNQQRKVENGEE
jgi:hypothetical protein